MNSGCICCTVRGDLIRILRDLRKDRFDSLVIETTGLSDPAPVAQTFFADYLLDIGAFDLDRKLEIDPNFLSEETHQDDASVDSVALTEELSGHPLPK